MRLEVRVSTAALRDALWRDGEGLYAQLRVAPHDPQANDYLLKYLSGSLRVAKSLITITHGLTSNRKTININTRSVDLQPMLDALGPVSPAGLFDDV